MATNGWGSQFWGSSPWGGEIPNAVESPTAPAESAASTYPARVLHASRASARLTQQFKR